MNLAIQVNEIVFKNYDEDDEKLSNARMTTIKRRAIIYIPDILVIKECEINKKYATIWFTQGFEMHVDHDIDELFNLYIMFKELCFRIDFAPDPDEDDDDDDDDSEEIEPPPPSITCNV